MRPDGTGPGRQLVHRAEELMLMCRRAGRASRFALVLLSMCALGAVAVPAVALALPDGRAYELVTPADTNGINTGPGFGSTDGNAVDWESIGGCCGATSSAVTLYQSTRTSTGWQTTSVTPKPSRPLVGLFAEQAPMWWSPDLSKTIFLTPASYTAGDQRPAGPGVTNYDDLYEEGPTGSMTWLTQGTFPGAGTNPDQATFDGATPDGNYVAFDSPEQLTPDATGLASLNTPAQFLYERDVTTGTTNLVNINSNPGASPVATSLTSAALGTTPTTLSDAAGPAVNDTLTAVANGHTVAALTAPATGQFSTTLSNPAGPAVNDTLTEPAVGRTTTTLTAPATGAFSTTLTNGAGPAVNTTLTSAASAGATTINVANANNLEPGEQITIDTGAAQEAATISAIGTPQAMQFSSSFNGSDHAGASLSDPTGLAMDTSGGSSNGDVYVADTGNFRVEKFSSSGSFILAFGGDVDATTHGNICTAASGDPCQAGTSGSTAPEFTSPQFVAVDNSTTAGDVYVGDRGDDTVSKFDSSGNLITSWATGGQLSGSGSFGSIDGIAVNPSGNLFVINDSNTVYEFDSSGAAVTNFGTTRGMSPDGLAVNSSGDLFKVNGSPTVEEWSQSTGDVGQVTQANTTELAIDPTTQDLLADTGGNVGVYEFNPSGQVIEPGAAPCTVAPNTGCPPTATFGSPTLSSGAGLAGSINTEAYVADLGNEDVAIFVPSTGGTPITLTAPLANSHASGVPVTHAADSSITVASSTGFAAGQTITVGSEMATVASVPNSTTVDLTAPLTSAQAPGTTVAYGGDTSITVASSAGFEAGQTVTIDTGASQEAATIASVPNATTIDLTSGLANNHASGAQVLFGGTEITVNDTSNLVAGETITIDTVASGIQETATIASVVSATDLQLTASLLHSHAAGVPVTYPGDSSITVASAAGFAPGQTINVDGEMATVASVSGSTIGLTATLMDPHAAGATVSYGGDTSIAVNSSAHFATGQTITIDPGGADQETATVASVPNSTTIDLTSGLVNNHASGESVTYAGDTEITVNDTSKLAVGETITIDTGAPQETATIASIPSSTQLMLSAPLANDHASGAPVTYPGDSSITVADASNFSAGQTITIDPGNPAQETDTIASVPNSTTIDLTATVSNPHSAGATVQHAAPTTTLAVASTSGFAAGQTITIDTSGSGVQETATIASVPDGTHLTLTAPLTNDHASGAPVFYTAGDTLVSPDGAILGNGNFLGEQYLPADVYGTTTNAISSDGSKLFFESPPSSPGGAGAEGLGPPSLYMRDVSTSTTTPISGSAQYEGASQDGSLVFYTSGGQLYEFNTTGSTIGQVPSMMSFSISAGSSGEPTAISNDGSHVYFVSTAVLAANTNAEGQTATANQPNLYVFDTTAAGTATTFIATLSQEDQQALTAEPDLARPAIPTPDGTVLVFESDNDLTGQAPSASTTLAADASPGDTSITVASTSGFAPGQTITVTGSDTDGVTGVSGSTLELSSPLTLSHASGDPVAQVPPFEIYRYAIADGSLVCVSCAPAGVPLTGGADLGASGGGSYEPSGNATPMSSNGSIIFFDSPDPLTAGVNNTGVFPNGFLGALTLTNNVFEWENGTVSLISDGSISTGAELGGTTPSGNDVFFTTRAHLVPQDTGGYNVIYDARVGGGFPAPSGPATAPCESAESCRPSIAPTVFFPVPSSSTLIAPNVGAPSFTVGSISAKRRKHFAKTGNLTLNVLATSAGKLTATASAVINGAQETVASATAELFATDGGKATLSLHLDNAARSALASKHKLVIDIAVSYSESNQVNIATLTLTTKDKSTGQKKATKKAGKRSASAAHRKRGAADRKRKKVSLRQARAAHGRARGR